MTEATNTNSTWTSPREMEPAIYDLIGAASLASLVLEAIASDPAFAASSSHKEGLTWLEVRLGAAAENLNAIHESRAPEWDTMMEARSIQVALDAAAERGEVRAANKAARLGGSEAA